MKALEEAIAAHAAGTVSAPVALMRVLLAGMPAEALRAALEARAPQDRAARALHDTATQRGACLETLERMVQAGAAHAPGTELDAVRSMFDRLAGISPEASVAAYSLGDPALLREGTAEILGWLRARGLLAGRPRVLDLGCGIGRLAAALAAEGATVLGLDVSERMVAIARSRHAGVPGLQFAPCSGRDLQGLPDGGFDLLIAADVFPYLVQAGVAEAHVAEAARVLRPGGHLVILNHDYGAADGGRAALALASARHGFAMLLDGERAFRLWDARAFLLRLNPPP